MATEKQIEHAWQKAATIRGKNPDVYRRDAHGNEIYKPSYGKQGDKSWELDHKVPVSKGGSEHLKNVRALQTAANRKKSDKHPHR